jgi:membrane associated rhomboid family serine protease
VLILPLHRRLTAANFPYVTALLVLINVLVFCGWQSGDDQILDKAAAYYQNEHIDQYELPAYRAWLKQQGRSEPSAPSDDDEDDDGVPPAQRAFAMIQRDDAFLAALRADRVITPEQDDYPDWRPLRSKFDEQWNSSFTERHLLHFSQFDLSRMFAAMFLHGGAEHLIGNMVFLALLGMLVEGALGGGLFLALYLLGGMGGQLFSLAWRWGEFGGALGASGAIAALMGAYCILWGKRRVRIFYWFFVVFDYVKVPALWLLPFWLGWQVLNLLFNDGAHIGFDAHAGGIASGALLALLAVKLGWRNLDYLDDEIHSEETGNAFERAQAHLGKLEIAPAKALLSPLMQAASPPLPLLLAWYRCCHYEKGQPELPAAVRRLLDFPSTSPVERGEIRKVLDDYLATVGAPPLSDAELLPLARHWLQSGALADGEHVLKILSARSLASPGLADAWLQLANAYRDGKDKARADRTYAYVLQNFAGSTAAQKAQFLLNADRA